MSQVKFHKAEVTDQETLGNPDPHQDHLVRERHKKFRFLGTAPNGSEPESLGAEPRSHWDNLTISVFWVLGLCRGGSGTVIGVKRKLSEHPHFALNLVYIRFLFTISFEAKVGCVFHCLKEKHLHFSDGEFSPVRAQGQTAHEDKSRFWCFDACSRDFFHYTTVNLPAVEMCSSQSLCCCRFTNTRCIHINTKSTL